MASQSVGTESVKLMVDLTEEEISEYQGRVTELVNLKQELEGARSNLMKKLKITQEEIEAKALAVKYRREEREIDCIWQPDYDLGRAVLINPRDGERVGKERALTDAELHVDASVLTPDRATCGYCGAVERVIEDRLVRHGPDGELCPGSNLTRNQGQLVKALEAQAGKEELKAIVDRVKGMTPAEVASELLTLQRELEQDTAEAAIAQANSVVKSAEDMGVGVDGDLALVDSDFKVDGDGAEPEDGGSAQEDGDQGANDDEYGQEGSQGDDGPGGDTVAADDAIMDTDDSDIDCPFCGVPVERQLEPRGSLIVEHDGPLGSCPVAGLTKVQAMALRVWIGDEDSREVVDMSADELKGGGPPVHGETVASAAGWSASLVQDAIAAQEAREQAPEGEDEEPVDGGETLEDRAMRLVAHASPEGSKKLKPKQVDDLMAQADAAGLDRIEFCDWLLEQSLAAMTKRKVQKAHPAPKAED